MNDNTKLVERREKRLEEATRFVDRIRRFPGTRELADAVDRGDVAGVADASQSTFYRGFSIAGIPVLMFEAIVALQLGFQELALVIAACGVVTALAVILTWKGMTHVRGEAWIHLLAAFFLLLGGLLVVLKYGHPEYIVWGCLFIPIAYYFLGTRNGFIAISVFGVVSTLVMINAEKLGLSPVPPGLLREVTASYTAFFILLGVFQLTREAFESSAVILARRLENLADSDPLTGRYNRRRLSVELEQRLAEFDRIGTALCLVMIDLDHFKGVNDQFGHQVGDEVLVQFADILRSTIRASDIPGRWGGEEFLLLLPGAAPHGAMNLAEKLRTITEETPFSHGADVTASFGVASCVPGDTTDTLIDRADRALYAAKQAGRNQVKMGLEQE